MILSHFLTYLDDIIKIYKIIFILSFNYVFIYMEKKFYVYQLKTSDGDVIYIGKGSGDRMNKHVKIANHKSKNRGKNPKLYNKISSVINKGGYIIPEILFEGSEVLCLEKEVNLIKEIGLKNLCNLTEGGEGTSGYKLSEETKAKMSEVKTGVSRIFSDEHKENIAKGLMGHKGYWDGKELSEETKAKMSAAKKGKKKGPISEKRRQAIIDGIKRKKEDKG